MSPEQHADAARACLARILWIAYRVRLHAPDVETVIRALCDRLASYVPGPMPVCSVALCGDVACLIPQAITSTHALLTHLGLARRDLDAGSLTILCVDLGSQLARLQNAALVDGRINVSRRGAA